MKRVTLLLLGLSLVCCLAILVGQPSYSSTAAPFVAGGPMPGCDPGSPTCCLQDGTCVCRKGQQCPQVAPAPILPSMLADGTDPMPLCRKGKPNCPDAVPVKRDIVRAAFHLPTTQVGCRPDPQNPGCELCRGKDGPFPYCPDVKPRDLLFE